MGGPRSATRALKEFDHQRFETPLRWDRPFTRTVGRLIDRARVYASPAGSRYGMLGTMPELPPHA